MTYINGRDMVLIIDGLDRSTEVATASFGPGTKQTFAQQRAQVPNIMNLKALQDDGTGTLYSLAIGASGNTVTGRIKPHGNVSASAALPHYTFTARPSGPAGDVILGGDSSDDSSEAYLVDLAWQITAWTQATTGS